MQSHAARHPIRDASRSTALIAACALMLAACSPTDPLEHNRALQAAGRFEESILSLEAEIDAGRDEPEILYLYGRALTATGQPSRALWPLRRAMETPAWLIPAALQLATGAMQVPDLPLVLESTGRVLEIEPDNTLALILRAQALAQTRQDYEEALTIADRVLEIDPESGGAMEVRVLALLGLDRIDEAGEAIELANAHFKEAGLGLSESARFCAVRGTFAKEKDQFDEAEQIFDACLEEYPAHYVVVDAAVKFFDDRNRPDRSLEIIRRAYEEMPQAGNYRLSLVLRLTARGEVDEAERLLVDATQVDDPARAASAFADLGGYYFELERFADSISAYESAIERAPAASPDLYFALAEALVLAGRYDEALALADEMEVVPHRELVRGRVALERGQPQLALEHFGKGLELWPDNAIARYLAALAAEQVGDFDRAIEEYRYSIRAGALETDARLRLARLHMAEGQNVPALEALLVESSSGGGPSLEQILLSLELTARIQDQVRIPEGYRSVIGRPTTWPVAVAAIASGARRRSGPVAAAEVVLQAERLDLTRPVNAPALEPLVIDLIDAGRTEEALAHARAGTAANPDSARMHAILGLALAHAGSDADAVTELDRALALQPDDASALFGKAQLEARAGRFESALALFERAAAAPRPHSDAAREAAAMLMELGRNAEAAERLEQRLLGVAPYDGRAALLLARIRFDQDPVANSRTARQLATRALRFGAGADAEDFIGRIDRATRAEAAPD